MRSKLALVLFILLTLSRLAWAGGGPAGFVVVYDPGDVRSVTIANAYQRVRGIPERNMVPYSFSQWVTMTDGYNFIHTLRAELQTRGLADQLQGIAMAGYAPIGSPQSGFCMESMIYLSPNYSQASFPAGSSPVPSFPQPSKFNGPSPAGTVAMTANTDFNGMRFWPVSWVGFPGPIGNNMPEILQFIDRAKAADGNGNRNGTVYLPWTVDIRSQTRAPQLSDVLPVWDARQIRHVTTLNPSASDPFPWASDRTDVQGGAVGVNQPVTWGNSYGPGAWVDIFTSVGGSMNSYIAPNARAILNSRCSFWLREGADGTSGSVGEPMAVEGKFPNYNIHTHLRAGASLAEAFWQSIEIPAEIMALGDPLLQPFAKFPVVSVSAPATGATVSGTLAIDATAAPTGGQTLEANLDLFVDGRRIAIGSGSEPVNATRTGSGFSLDTTTLADGWHDLRVVAYNNDAVRSQGEAVFTVIVNNAGQSIALTGPPTVNPDSTVSFTVTPAGLGDLTSLVLRANGRTLATLPVAGGNVNVNLANSASLAPLIRDWTVYAVGTRSNGQQVWSPPFTTTADWPATPASTPTPGPAMMDVRYFASTTAPGFNWDTTTPDVVTTFNGDDVQGLYLTPGNSNIPGIPSLTSALLANKPAYDMQLWVYAPKDDWYEIGLDYQGAGPSYRAVILDGLNLSEGGNKQYGPRRLAAGWHSLRLQLVFATTPPPYLRYHLRGGANQDFLAFDRVKVANHATGATPTIQSVTPSAAPVTGTSVTLTANATSGDGSALTYYWGLGGPMGKDGNMPVSFSANGTTAAATTTATFTQPGNYKLALKVAGAAGSAVTIVDVAVQPPAALAMTMVTGGITNVVQGEPLELQAFSKDQFGRRVPITGTDPDQPTVQWSSSVPGTFTYIDASRETARFQSSAPAGTFTITATGVNGRTGSVISPTINLVGNAPPTVTGDVFAVGQDQSNRFLFTLTATVNDPETVLEDPLYGVPSNGAPAYQHQFLDYQWSVISTPPGQTLTLSGTDLNIITATASGAGTYQVRLTATDQGGASVSQTKDLLVAADGTALWTGFGTTGYISNVLTVGESAYLSMQRPLGTETYQWQTRADGGATWSNLTGSQFLFGDELNPYYYSLVLEYGPVSLADNGRQFRLLTTNAAGTIASDTITLTVTAPTGGTIVATTNSPLVITEQAGNVTMILRRAGDFTGAASADYSWDNGITTGSGTKSWSAGQGGDKTVSVPIPNNASITVPGYIYFSIDGTTINGVPGAGYGYPASVSVQVLDGQTPAITLTTSSLTVEENAGTATLTVSRQGSATGAFSVNYATVDGTAIAGQSYTATSGSLSWADGDTTPRSITIPLINDPALRGDLQFSVQLTATDPLWLRGTTKATVTVKDAPYQQWQQEWWPSDVPATTIYSAYPTAAMGANPLFLFRLGESSGTSVSGVNGSGASVLSGTLSKTGTGGNYTLAQAGPRPPAWPGLVSTNSALQFVAASPSGVRYSQGASINCGTALGIGPRLSQGFTFSAFVKTSVTDKFMALAGGIRTTAPASSFAVGLNQVYGNSTTAVPHALRLYIKSGTPVLEYSVVFQNLPTGSLCDGQWHHIAITQPAFTDLDNTDYARFYFDGTEVNALSVRGAETMDSTTTCGEFNATGFCLGNDGAIASTIRYFNGSLDEAAFIPSVLTPAAIAGIATAQPQAALPANMTDTGNPSGDGIPNLFKYILGLDPLTPEPGGLPPLAQLEAAINSLPPEESYIGVRANQLIPTYYPTTGNNRPVALAQNLSTAEDTALAITLAGTDVENSPLTYAVVTQPTKGTLSGTAPNLTYTPNAYYAGSDSFTFTVNDGTDTSVPATVSITVIESDSDGDGIPDLEENQIGTNPLNPDTDGDGVGDWYEVYASFTGPNNPTDKPRIPYPLPKPDSSTGATNKPVKVFILMGQSNMVGRGLVNPIDTPGTLSTIAKQQHKFTNLLDAANNWSVRMDVRYRGIDYNNPSNYLSVGQGGSTNEIGPELGFGHALGYYLDEPVLVIKSAMGGKNLGYNYLPPGSPRYTIDGTTYAGYGDGAASWPAGSNPPPPATDPKNNAGGWYDYNVSKAKEVLTNFNTLYPQYAAQGYQVAGFCWVQGEADAGSAIYTPRYESNLVNFINAVRADFGVTNAPFVAATLGQNGMNMTGNYLTVCNAQLAVGDPTKHPEFAGKVKSMDTRKYWRSADQSPTPSDPVHYYDNAETSMLIGDALGRGMIDLLEAGAGNTPPVALAQSLSTAEDTALAITLTGTDAENSALTFAVVTSPSHGTLSGTAPNLTYTPALNYTGSDSFTFTVNDGTDTSAPATVSIAVGTVNVPPVAVAQSLSTAEDTALAITLTGTDAENSTLTFAVATQPSHGTLSGTAPNLTYTPNANYNGSDSFTFTVNDGAATSVPATVSITVTPVNDAPVALAQNLSAAKDTALAITLAGTDVENSALTFAVATSPSHGTLSGTAPNLSYTPALNYTGPDSFTFTVNDGTATSAPATVSITVNSTQILVWDGDTSVTWATGANWSGGTAPANSLITDIARFNLATAPSFQPTATSGGSINGLIFGNDSTATATTTIATATGTSRLNVGDGGILMNGFSGVVNIGTAAATQGLRLGASQTWTNDSSSLLTVSSLGNNDTGDYTLTLAGAGSGGITLTNVVQDGSATNTTALVVNMNGSGITTLSGANTFTGGLTLTAGTLMLGNNAALGATASTLTITGGTIDVNAARSMSGNNAQNWNGDFTFAGSNTWGTGTGAVTMNASRQVTVNASTMTVGGAIGQSGSGYGLTKAGAGTLVLNVANTYTGETKVNEGLLRFTVATALPGGMGSSGGTSALTLNGGVVGLTTGGSTAFTRGLGTGSHQVQWTGSGGFAAISGGTHTVNLGGSAAGVTWASGNFVPDGASLILGHATAGNQINFANPIDFNSATRTIQVDNGSAATDAGINGALTNGGLRKTGEGTLSLTVANSYSGGTTVDAGTLFMGNSSALGSTSGQLTVNAGTLNMGSNSLTVGNLTGTGGIISGTSASTRTLTIGQGNNGGGNYQGSIQNGTGTTALTKTGSSIITLSGINTYSGATQVTNGTLVINGSISTSALTTVAAGATLAGTGTTGAATVNGIVSPGSGVGTLNADAVIWNGAATPGPATDWRFDLATPAANLAAADAAPATACDRLNLTGDLTKGTAGAFRFDFGGYSGASGWFKLIEWTGSTTFTAADFSATNLGAGKSAAFTVDAATKALYVEITGSGPTGYELWQQTNGATGQTPDQDHDNDGVANGIEYFVGGTTGFTALPGVVGDAVTWPKSAAFPINSYGTTYKLQTSVDLSPSGWIDVAGSDPKLINTGTSVGYNLLPVDGVKRFVRLVVTP